MKVGPPTTGVTCEPPGQLHLSLFASVDDGLRPPLTRAAVAPPPLLRHAPILRLANRQGSDMRRLPATGMNHSLAAAWFALDCLFHALVDPHRKKAKP